MRQVTIYTADQDYNQFMELVKSLQYVKKIETDDGPTKQEIVENLKRGFEDIKLLQEGKLKTTSFKDFMNEL